MLIVMMNALALLVGNADYSLNKDKLENAVNDVKDVSKKLFNLGFVTQTLFNSNVEMFDRQLKIFGKNLSDYDVGLFYFAGHGLQIDGENFLTAVDTNFHDESSAKYTSINLDQIISYMQKAKTKINIIILDACRNNPLPKNRGFQNNGLAPIYAPKGTIIAFSTSPGETAMDAGAGRNSIYTGAFLNHIDDPHIPVEEFFKRIRTSVYTLTSGKQTSWEHTSLIGDFYFNSKQLLHTTNLLYKDQHIADEKFLSDGSDIENIIVDLRSYDYYTQKPAILKLRSINVYNIDKSSLFLLGRNLLQTAIGGEYSALALFKNLASSLEKYFSVDGCNHVFNGILFEIYFNSKGRFRKENFKTNCNEEIFELQDNVKFSKSFVFIQKQLAPFRQFLFYFPTTPSKALPIEIYFEEYEYELVGKNRKGHKVTSIKYSDVEIMEPYQEDEWNSSIVSYRELIDKICKELCVPKSKLRLSKNVDDTDLKKIDIPYPFKLTK